MKAFNQSIILILVAILSLPMVQGEEKSVQTRDPFTTQLAKISLYDQTRSISLAEYYDYYQDAVRSKFYHGRAPENEVDKVKSESWQALLEDTIVAMDLEQSKVKFEPSQKVAKTLEEFAQRYVNNPAWEEMKSKVLPVVESRLLRKEKVKLKKKLVEDAVSVSDQEVKQFYLKNPQLFTEPERNEVSIILISVDPSSSKDIWQKAIDQMTEIKKQIHSIEDFRKMAELYSTDPTADEGGNMGILHEGQLGGVAMETVKKLEVGEVSEPLVLLEGVALLTVTKRIGATHHTFEDVKKRATALTLREKRKQAWQNYLGKIKEQASVETTPVVKDVIPQGV